MIDRLILIPLIVLTSAASAQEQPPDVGIGVAEWINPSTTGQAPGTEGARDLEYGARVVEKEEVKTNPAGAADFSFYNRSRLLVGPECRVTLDHRYYDRELNVDIKEFSVYANTRCVLKADNSIAADPRDRIILKTPLAEIVIDKAAAYVQYAPEAVTELPGEAQYQLLSIKVSTGGEVAVITGLDEKILVREGYMVWIDPSSDALGGPARASLSVVLALQAPLEGVVAASERPPWQGGYILEDLDQAGFSPGDPILPPASCIGDECEIFDRAEDQMQPRTPPDPDTIP